MKKTNFLVILLSSVFLCQISNAQAPLIYCPDKVVCSEKGSLGSCSFDSSDKSLWVKIYNAGIVENGIYAFSDAQATYQFAKTSPSCRYINSQAGFIKYIELRTDAPIEASAGKDTGWFITGWSAACTKNSGSAANCPLQKYN